MAVAYGAVGVGGTSTFTHTFGSSDNAILIAEECYGFGEPTAPTITGVTFTELGTFVQPTTSYYFNLWGASGSTVSALAGTSQTVTLNGLGLGGGGSSVSYSGVSSFGTPATNTGASTSASVSVSSASGDMAFVAMLSIDGSGTLNNLFTSFSGTQRFNGHPQTHHTVLLGDAAGAGTVNFTATAPYADFAAIAVDIVAAAGNVTVVPSGGSLTLTGGVPGAPTTIVPSGFSLGLSGGVPPVSTGTTPSSFDVSGTAGNFYSSVSYTGPTVNTGNYVLTAVIAQSEGASPSVTTATYDGHNMAFLGSVPLNNVTTHGVIFLYGYAVVPGSGAKTIAFAVNGGYYCAIGAESYYVSGGSVGAPVAVYGYGNTLSQSVTCGSGQLVVSVMGTQGTSAITSHSGGTFRLQPAYSNESIVIQDSTTSTTFTVGLGGNDNLGGLAIVLGPAPVTVVPSGSTLGLTGGVPLVAKRAVVFDASGGTAAGGFAASGSCSITATAGADAFVFLSVASGSPTAVTYGSTDGTTGTGTAMTLVDLVYNNNSSSNGGVWIYHLAGVAGGAKTVAFALSGAADVQLTVETYLTVGSFSSVFKTYGSASPMSQTITNAFAGMILQGFSTYQVISTVAGGTQRYLQQGGSSFAGLGVQDTAAVNATTFTGTMSGSYWAGAALVLNPAPTDITVTPAGGGFALAGGTPIILVGGPKTVVPTGVTIALTGSAATVTTSVTPFKPVIDKLTAAQSGTVLFIGDSTTVGYGDLLPGSNAGYPGNGGFPPRFVVPLGIEFDVNVPDMTWIGYIFTQPSPYYTSSRGGSAPSLNAFVAGGVGQSLTNFETLLSNGLLTAMVSAGITPDVIILGDGFNDNGVPPNPTSGVRNAWIAAYQTFITNIRATLPTTPIIITTQNMTNNTVDTYDGTYTVDGAYGAAWVAFATALGCSGVNTASNMTFQKVITPAVQQTNLPNVYMVDTRQAFSDVVAVYGDDSELSYDGLHPDSAGYSLIALQLMNQLTALRPSYVLPGPTSTTMALTGGTPPIGQGKTVTPAGFTLGLTGGAPPLKTVVGSTGFTLGLTGGTPLLSAAALATLTDNFTTQNSTLWSFGSGASVVAGQLNEVPGLPGTAFPFTFPAVFGTAPASIVSQNFYNFTGSSIYIQMVQAPNVGSAAGVWTQLQLYTPDYGHALSIGWNNNTLYFINNADLTHNVTYSSANHRWWRMRESGGTVYYDTSPDSVAWTNQYSTAWTMPQISSLIVVVTSYAGGDTNVGTAVFDNVNTSGPITVMPTGFTLGLTGGVPSVTAGPIQPAGFSLGLSGGTPIVNQMGGFALSLTGGAPPVGKTLTSSGFSVGFTGGSPPIIGTLEPGSLTLGLTGGIPPVINPNTVVPGGFTLGLTGDTPPVTNPVTVKPAAVTLGLVGGVPILSAPGSVVPTGGLLALTGGTPLISAAVKVVPAAGAFGLIGGTPPVYQTRTVTPTGASLTWTGSAASISNAPVTISGAGAVLGLTGGTPGVSVSANVTIAPNGFVLDWVGGSGGSGPRTIRPTGAVLALSGSAIGVRVWSPPRVIPIERIIKVFLEERIATVPIDVD